MASATNHSMFEALFDRRLKPAGAFAQALLEAGYDPDQPQPSYPTEVWVRCLEVARRERWPDLPDADAWRFVGREFAEGFLETLLGRMVNVALPFLAPASFLRRLHGFFRLGRSDDRLTFEVVDDAPGRAEVVVHNPAAVPGGFMAGMIDAAFSRFDVRWTIDVAQRTPHDYVLTIRWS